MDTSGTLLPKVGSDEQRHYVAPKLVELGDVADLTHVISVNVN